VVIQDHKFFGDLKVLPSNDIDVILGVDWITAHKGVTPLHRDLRPWYTLTGRELLSCQ
jgi:hypothetical protein